METQTTGGEEDDCCRIIKADNERQGLYLTITNDFNPKNGKKKSASAYDFKKNLLVGFFSSSSYCNDVMRINNDVIKTLFQVLKPMAQYTQ